MEYTRQLLAMANPGINIGRAMKTTSAQLPSGSVPVGSHAPTTMRHGANIRRGSTIPHHNFFNQVIDMALRWLDVFFTSFHFF